MSERSPTSGRRGGAPVAFGPATSALQRRAGRRERHAPLAFFVGGLVVLATGHNPIDTYKAIFNGTGLDWLLPGVGEPRQRRLEPAADADRRDAVDADRPRARIRLPLRHVQHRRPGSVSRRPVVSVIVARPGSA